MKIEHIHLIKGDDLNAIFHYPTMTLIEVNDLVYDVLLRLKNNDTIESIALKTQLKQADIEALISHISNATPDFSDKKEIAEPNPSKKIGRITLHVANGCNLRCSYCYANGGDYKLPENLMTMETASQFVDFCITNFDKIETIAFFGGEPLLNPKIINYICETFDNLYKTNQITFIPEFGIITNGTIINDEILDIIKKHIKFITVSIDGPQNLNDYNRKFRNGDGSYSKISDFIRKIQTETDVYLKYEATYTPYHHENKWNKSDVKLFLFKEFNMRGSIVPDINYQWHSDTDTIKEENFPEGFFSILRSMTHKIHKEMCLIGRNIVAISTEGELYPCHMNTGVKHLSLGHISGENIFNSLNKFSSNFPYLKSISQTEKPCVDCWANPVCGGCAMYWFYDKDNACYNQFPKQSFCESNKKQIENILLLIARLKKDKTKWAELLERIKTLDDHDLI
jgi:uncharacterized protein